MKKIYESELHNYDNYESAEKVIVYQITSEDEYWDFSNMTHKERCEYFNVFDEGRYYVAPGARYRTYSFDYSTRHVIMYETIAMNV
jgi:hypothetical protein